MLRAPVTLEPAGAAGSVTVLWETSEPYQVLSRNCTSSFLRQCCNHCSETAGMEGLEARS